MKAEFVVVAHLRDYLLDKAAKTRHHKFTRVAADVYAAADGHVLRWADSLIASLPSKGRTISVSGKIRRRKCVGTEGQDRESYSDEQDRESYTVSREKEGGSR